MRALIVVPTYNEIENLKSLVEAIFQGVPAEIDVLIVDDGSPDGTGELADSLAQQYPGRLSALHRPRKMGLGTAYIQGLRWGLSTPKNYEAFIEMDADFSHDPKYLPRMLELLADHDVVIGSRYVKGGGTLNWGWTRKLISRGGSLYSRLILGAGIADFTGGFNGWRRHVLEAIDLESLRSDGYSFQIELKYRAFLAGYRIVEFPILFEDRKVGKSKMNRKIVIEALGRVWGFRMQTLKSVRRPQGRQG